MKQNPVLSRIVILFLSLALVVMTGCPKETPPPADGGTPDNGGPPPDRPVQLTECPKGNACISIAAKGVRGCDMLLLSETAVTTPSITFDAEIVGQSKYLGNKIALSWITAGDADPASKRFVTTLKVESGVKTLKLHKVVCFDRTGAKLTKPQVSLQIP